MAEIRLQPSTEESMHTIDMIQQYRKQIQKLDSLCHNQQQLITDLETQIKAQKEEFFSFCTQQQDLMNNFQVQLNISGWLHNSNMALGAKLCKLEAERGSSGYSLRVAPNNAGVNLNNAGVILNDAGVFPHWPGLDDAEGTQEAANGLSGGETSARITQ